MVAHFEKIFISPGFVLNFRKSHQISKIYVKNKSSESYGQKPGLNIVNFLLRNGTQEQLLIS